MMNTDWFSGNLPYETKVRHDGKFNVWNIKPFDFDGELDLKWYVAGVFDTETEAKAFMATKR